jgi:hypothetical protein
VADTIELTLSDLLDELELARRWSHALIADLDPDQVSWRPHEDSSAIGWHLGHQAVVAHFMIRNLTAAEPSFDPALDRLFDSATEEPARGSLPPLPELLAYRSSIAASVDRTVRRIDAGDVGAPEQLSMVAATLLRSLVYHEYQHATWMREVRETLTDTPSPEPGSRRLTKIQGYWMLA